MGRTIITSGAPGRTRPRAIVQETGKSPFRRTLEFFQTGQFALAGFAKEAQAREFGGRRVGFGRSIIKGVREKTSFGEVTGNPWTGLGLDIILDPVNLIPLGAVAGAAKAISKLPTVVKTARVVSEVTEAVPQVAKIRNTLGRAFKVDFGLKKVGADEVLVAKNKLIEETEGTAVVLENNVFRKLERIEPDENVRKQVFDLVERAPIGKPDLADPKFVQFRNEFAALSSSGKLLFRESNKVLKELEKIKVEAGLLTEERLAGFLRKFNVRYVPRQMATKSDVLSRLREAEQSLLQGEKVLDASADIGTVQKWIQEIDAMPEVLQPGQRQRMIDFYNGDLPGRIPSFLLRRTTPGTAKEAAKTALREIELDIAKALGGQTREVTRAVAAEKYLASMTNFLKQKGLLFDEAVAKNPELLELTLIKQGLPRLEARKLVNLGFEEVRRVPEMKGLFAPKDVVGQITRAASSYRDPKAALEILDLWANGTNIWKAWTLSLFPSYHTRNIISNHYNNWLAGMNVTNSIPDYQQSWNLIMKSRKGAFSNNKVLGDMTDKQLWDLALKKRVLRGGAFMGELGATMTQRSSLSTFIKSSTIDVANNKALQFGFRWGTHFEDHARLAQFMWRLRRGEKADDAARGVNKFLFDYKYGLTDLERKVFRDRLMPFWAWTRFNLPLQLEMLVTQPRKFVVGTKIKRAWEDQFGGPQPNEIFLADWMKRQFKIRWRYSKDKKEYEFFILDSWWPATDVGKIMGSERIRDELVNLTTPFLKAPAEMWFNYSLFKKRKIEAFPGQKKKLLGVSLPARTEELLRQVRLINEIDRALEARNRSGWIAAVIRPLIGRSYPVDIAKQKRWWTFSWNLRIRELKKQRNSERHRIAAGRPAAKSNIEELDRLIQEAEVRLRENK